MTGAQVLILIKAVVCTQLEDLWCHTTSAVCQMSIMLLEHRQVLINGFTFVKKKKKGTLKKKLLTAFFVSRSVSSFILDQLSSAFPQQGCSEHRSIKLV